MSACLILQLEKNSFIGSDTAMSSLKNNVTYRSGEVNKKIFTKDNYIFFCSGEYKFVKKTLNFINSSTSFSLNALSEFLINSNLNKNKALFNIEIVFIDTITNNIYQISEYNDFKINVFCPPKKGVYVITAGFKTEECYKLAEKEILENKNIFDIYYNTFKNLSCEQIGGKLMVYNSLKKQEPIIYNQIDDIRNEEFTEFHLISGDVLVGNLIAGESLKINNESETFLSDHTGTTIKNADFKIVGETINGERYGLKLDANELRFGLVDETNTITNSGTKLLMDKSGTVDMKCSLIVSSGAVLGGWSVSPVGLIAQTNPITQTDSNFFMKTIADTSGENKDLLFRLGDFTVDKYGTVKAKINFDSLPASALADLSVGGSKIQSGTIPSSAINGDTTKFTAVLAPGTQLNGNCIMLNSTPGSAFANGSISQVKFSSVTVSNANDLPDEYFTRSKIADNSIRLSDFADGAFKSGQFAFGAVYARYFTKEKFEKAGATGSMEVSGTTYSWSKGHLNV